MLKRLMPICLAAGVGLATLQGATAEAQWAFFEPPGMWWYYGTVDGCATIARIPNPDTRPARLQCDLTLTRIETLCINPNDNDVRPGVAGSKVVVNRPFNPQDYITAKKKGKADVCVALNEETALGPGILCPNRNWNFIANDPLTPETEVGALTREFIASCSTQECTAKNSTDPCTTTVVKDKHMCKCTLDPQYTTTNAPAVGTAYTCRELDPVTLQDIGVCQLPTQ